VFKRKVAVEGRRKSKDDKPPGANLVSCGDRLLAPPIMRGDLEGLNKIVSHQIVGNDLAKMKGNIASAKGIGESIIADFYSGVEGFKISQNVS
jgi:hypothetical protein